MDIVKYPALAKKTIKTLNDIAIGREFKPAHETKRRLGMNGVSNLSDYETSNWMDWTATDRSHFKHQFNDAFMQFALTGYFIRFPANTGKLDLTNKWQGQKMAGTIIAYAIKGNGSIWLDGVEYTVKQGEGIGFSLKHVHEVKTSSEDVLWANLMILGHPPVL